MVEYPNLGRCQIADNRNKSPIYRGGQQAAVGSRRTANKLGNSEKSIFMTAIDSVKGLEKPTDEHLHNLDQMFNIFHCFCYL